MSKSLLSAFGKSTEAIPLVVAPTVVSKRKRDDNADTLIAGNDNDGDAGSRKHAESKSKPDEPKGPSRKERKQAEAAASKDDPDRLSRTLFVGNLALHVTQVKLAGLFRRHLQSLRGIPSTDSSAPSDEQAQAADGGGGAKPLDGQEKGDKYGPDIESIRFRNIPIEKVAVAPGANYKQMIKAAVALGKVVGAPLASADGEDAAAAAAEEAGKRPNKKGKQVSGSIRDTMHAYVVFRTAEAAKQCLALNGTEFEGKHLRVDSTKNQGEKSVYDHKRSVFVGNLPFDSSEEDVRALFAATVAGGDAAVDSIRIVRDKITHKGKGIAFVLFKERTSVVEALGMDGKPMNGRELRVQRCSAEGAVKTGPGGEVRHPARKATAKDRNLPKHMGVRADTSVKAVKPKQQKGMPTVPNKKRFFKGTGGADRRGSDRKPSSGKQGHGRPSGVVGIALSRAPPARQPMDRS